MTKITIPEASKIRLQRLLRQENAAAMVFKTTAKAIGEALGVDFTKYEFDVATLDFVPKGATDEQGAVSDDKVLQPGGSGTMRGGDRLRSTGIDAQVGRVP